MFGGTRLHQGGNSRRSDEAKRKGNDDPANLEWCEASDQDWPIVCKRHCITLRCEASGRVTKRRASAPSVERQIVKRL